MKYYCDHTECFGRHKLYLVQLKPDFGSNIVSWCSQCIIENRDMIEDVLKRHRFPKYSTKQSLKLNAIFDIR